MEKFLVIVRHGEYSGGDSSPLSEDGHRQMESLKKVINTFVTTIFDKEVVTRICFSFSSLPRSMDSIQRLSQRGEDIIVTSLMLTEREDIREPQKILDKVMGIANHYDASIIVIVAHGDMPTVIAETARDFAKGKKVESKLPYVRKGHGFIVSLVTGEVTSIGYDLLEKKEPPQPAVQKPPPQAVAVKSSKVLHVATKSVAPKPQQPLFNDDDIPF